MKIFVKAKPGAFENKIEKLDETHYKVSVTAPPIKGMANLAIAKALADHFGVSMSQIEQISGFKSHQKIFEINL